MNTTMTIDGKKILEKLAAARKEERGRVTLYLSKAIYEEFRARCGDIPPSVVLEELLREFVASAPEKPKTGQRRRS
jgi:hypothetical protein